MILKDLKSKGLSSNQRVFGSQIPEDGTAFSFSSDQLPNKIDDIALCQASLVMAGIKEEAKE